MALACFEASNIGFLIQNKWKIRFYKQIFKSVKTDEKMMKISFSTSGQFWQQEMGQLTSANVSYQMVGLCDYKNILYSYVLYI